MPRLIDLLLKAQVPADYVDDVCQCGNGKRQVACFDCIQYELSCTDCFVAAHRNHPLHWAEVWSPDAGCFVKCDLSGISLDFSIPFGHGGNCCPSLLSDDVPKEMTLVDVNGIHRTRVRFCACAGLPNRAEQLMTSGFFPSSLKRPRMAFSFAILHHFHLLQLESKTSAYDFCGTLRRLTDNVFTHRVPVKFFFTTMISYGLISL